VEGIIAEVKLKKQIKILINHAETGLRPVSGYMCPVYKPKCETYVTCLWLYAP